MSQDLSEAGVFRGQITDYGLVEAKSGAKAVALTAAIHDVWDAAAKEWVDWRQYDLQAHGRVWVVKKDGELSTKDIEALAKHLDFTDFVAVVDGTWAPGKCSFTVDEELYEGKTYYRLSFVNDYDRTPGMQSTVSYDDAKQWNSRYGGQIRAIVGNAKRNGAVPAGKPAVPAAPKPAAPKQSEIPTAPAQPPTDDVPF